MKSCGYCGKENEDALAFCAGCGCTFGALVLQAPPPIIAPPLLPIAPPAPRELRAGLATGIFGVYLGGQFIGGFIAGVIGGASSGMLSPDGTHVESASLEAIMPWTIFLTMILGGIAVVWMVLGMELPVADTSPTGPAWVRGPWRNVAKGLMAGIILASLWVLLMMSFGHRSESDHELSPMARMATEGGMGRIIWVITALFLAPPVEELLFRGVFYAGYRKSFGAAVATFVTTAVFVGLHFPEFVYQPLAIIAITGLSLVTLSLRLRFNAIGPSIAAHFGYNAVVASLLFLVK
jgi:membrane protease YdiL (CAAX protease family)